jgi:hypothetical protein
MEQFYKEDENALERVEKLEDSLAKREYELDIKIKENEGLRKEFKDFTDNPIRYELIRLLRDDTTVERSIHLSIENEVDNQVGSLKDEILDEVDEKLEGQFETFSFKMAVSDYIRSKF